ncbi:MAG TPA: ABC transporter substrate-binding protein, partial [Ilumatobacteraceae bacterium]|nr:ABC transporter substrate-binding protein [Ilumatobacteraceae bacterium]
ERMTPMRSRPSRHRPFRLRLAALGAVAVTVAAACSSGESALVIDQDETTDPPAATTDDGTEPDGTSAAPTTTQAPLAEFPDCPTDALDGAAGPVEITFWHGMNDLLEDSLIALTDEYNASQDRVRVVLQNQTGYNETIDQFIQSSQSTRPVLVQFPEYTLQSFAQSDTLVPIDACIESSGYDTSAFIPRALEAYTWQGIQWSMPFNVSNPVLYYIKPKYEAAGLDPEQSPISLEELRVASQQIVDSGAATYGWVLDSGADSGGGWFLEQWFGRAGVPFADNGNGRDAPATEVFIDSETGVELLTFVQEMIDDGLAVSVGDNAGGTDVFLKLIDPAEDGAMTIGTSAALGGVIDAIGGGLAPGLTTDDVGIGPMPGPSDTPAVQVGGASLWITADKSPEETSAAWDYITFLVSAQSQSEWAATTGYVPIRTDALDLDPVASTYADDPRFKVAYDQLIGSVEGSASLAPVLGPQREVRVATANATAAIFGGADVQTALSEAAAQANALIASYNQRN